MDIYTIRNKLNMGIPLTSISLRVTDYARVSTDRAEQMKSLKNQVEHFEEYIKQNKNWVYVNGYVDDGVTGTSDVKRSNFMQMIEDARRGKFDLIITKEISRFSRNTLDSIKYTRLLLSYGVFVLFVNDNINTALPDSELRLTIMASMAQDEVRRLSERVKFGMNRAILRGEILGNNKLYGYVKDKSTGRLKIVEDEAMTVKKIYELYVLEELSLLGIVTYLKKKGIMTRDGKEWSGSTLSRMIKNPKYKGYYCGKKSEIVDYMSKKVKYFDESDWVVYEDRERIPAIISEYLWDKANERLSSRSKRGIRKDNYSGNYLYSGKLFCGRDGSVFNRRMFRRNNRDVTWVCSNYLGGGKKTCDSSNIREEELNFIFNDVIEKLEINKLEVISSLVDIYKNNLKNQEVDVDIDIFKKKIKNINVKKDKLLELSIDGKLSNEEFDKRNSSFNEELKKLETQVRQLASKENLESDELIEIEEYLKKKVDEKSFLDKLVSLVLKKIVVYKFDNNKIKLDIYICDDCSLDGVITNHYEFKRGYDVVGTKRYTVNYEINCYI